MTTSTRSPTQTPRLVRFAVWLTFFNTWVLFEETVVDRYGLWEYMPYYRVGRFCSWDIGAMALLGFVVWRIFRGRKLPEPVDGSRATGTRSASDAGGLMVATSRSSGGARVEIARPGRPARLG